MRKLKILIVIVALISWIQAKNTEIWHYNENEDIVFAENDSLAQPYKCTVDSAGNLWVISSTATSTESINALYKASPGDSKFTLVDNYTDDNQVDKTTGITNLENDILVLCQQDGSPVVSFVYYYPEGDIDQKYIIDDVAADGYGTKISGFEATQDNYIFGGIIYKGPKIRGFDYTSEADPFGHYISDECESADPGGSYILGDAIRDIAINPNGDYSDPNTPLYTSRNSALSGEATGGVTKWTGGVQDSLLGYQGEAIDDVSGFLNWTSHIPNGITCDSHGRLWAIGTDPNRRWVKIFQIDGNWATQVNELPSSTSEDVSYSNGAPLSVPADVSLSPDENTAYVTDLAARKCFVFSTSETAIDITERISGMEDFFLYPAFPNPFNPTTSISFYLPNKAMVAIELYNLQGIRIKSIEKRTFTKGKNEVNINCTGLPTGIYFYRVSSKFGSYSEKITLMK